MDEKVLAVPRNLIESALKQGFFRDDASDLIGTIGERSVFLDRKLAEEDRSHKQIIPYIVITHDNRFLVYRRTSKQGEKRLHNKFSLGFGGHINDGDHGGRPETNLILAALVRELNEEVYIPSVQQLSVVGFLNDDSNPVGQVHLGVAILVEAANDRFSVNEPEMIEAQWTDCEGIEKILPTLESWSQLFWSQHLAHRLTGTQRSL